MAVWGLVGQRVGRSGPCTCTIWSHKRGRWALMRSDRDRHDPQPIRQETDIVNVGEARSRRSRTLAGVCLSPSLSLSQQSIFQLGQIDVDEMKQQCKHRDDDRGAQMTSSCVHIDHCHWHIACTHAYMHPCMPHAAKSHAPSLAKSLAQHDMCVGRLAARNAAFARSV